MDYEKKYKEALERARQLYDSATNIGDIVGCDLESIFPELAESEDERIRKELKEAFEAYDIESKWNGIPVRSIFAWLEKQKEQKPEWSEEDEEMLEYVIGDLNDAKQLFSAKDAIDLCDKEIAWLKSLRPSWKPSEEQMAALEAATVRYQSTGLESLYEDLKKL